MTVHTLPAAELAPVGQTRKGRLTMLLVLLACAAPVIASYFSYYVVRPSARSNYAELIQPTVGIPAALALTDAAGQAVPPLTLKGQWLMVVVAGGACDERCEKLLFAQRQLREMMGREKERVDRVLLVTDDAPVRAPIQEALRSGTPATVLRVQREALASWLKPDTGSALEDHIYLVDPMGEWMMRTPVDLDPARFRKDLERLLRASSSWDREGRGS
ncbi:SCO family protein [Ideonella margarita]|uniref:Cytochrome oxidase Cu insertion factor (SCO1/SenC/PrrC family) n=1 Tax=Ideonella margarita TaxID=2984191 RepID=A0ABU9BZT0_9BURK